MNRKGFTFVELIAVIIVLIILVLIVYPVVTNLINSVKESGYERQVKMLINVGNEWLIYNKDKLNKNEINCISIQRLKDEQYLKSGDIIDTNSGNYMNGYLIFTFNSSLNQYEIIYNDTCE